MHLTLISESSFVADQLNCGFEYHLNSYFPKPFSYRISKPYPSHDPIPKSMSFESPERRKAFFNQLARNVSAQYGSPFLFFVSVYDPGGYATDLGAFVDLGSFSFSDPGIARIAAHELGHVFGIPHHLEQANPQDPCLMDTARAEPFFSSASAQFCSPCKAHLEQRL